MENKNNLVGRHLPVLDKGYVKLVDWMGTDARIVEAARVSYGSPSKGEEQDKKLLTYLWKNQHMSPFEMVKITFEIKMPIFVARQYFRHRLQSANEISARYTEVTDDFYIPAMWRKPDTKNKQGSTIEKNWQPALPEGEATAVLTAHCQQAYNVYQSMLASGIAREMARMVLPLNTYTKLYCCWDLRNLLNFFRQRLDNHAQWEIQEYARAMYAIAEKLFPWTIEAFNRYSFQLVENYV